MMRPSPASVNIEVGRISSRLPLKQSARIVQKEKNSLHLDAALYNDNLFLAGNDEKRAAKDRRVE